MDTELPEPGIGEGPAKAISVSLPEGTVRALRATAGNRGVSTLIATAVEEHLRNIVTDEYLAGYEREHGDFTAEEKRAADAVWARAAEEQATWREAG